MRLTLHTDYAIRVMIEVGVRNGELVTISEIADRYDISKNHLTKVVHQLGRTGFLETVRGKYGGIRLMRRPEDILLSDLVRHAEDDFDLVRCEGEEPCRLSGMCVARAALNKALNTFFGVLDGVTLADMIAAARDN